MEKSTFELTNKLAIDGEAAIKSEHAPWKRTFWRFRPLLGLAALFMCVGCMITSLIILLWSNSETTASWPIQPAVYLSITTSVGNALLRFALLQALPFAWWRHTLHGRTVKELHKEWAVGHSIYHAIANWRVMGVTGFASISCALLAFVGPLLQRASTVVEALQFDSTSLQFQIAPELPTGWAGVVNSEGNYMTTDAFTAAFRDYLQGTPIFTNVIGCEGTCTAKVSAPGLASSLERCDNVTVDLNGYNQLDQWPQEYPGSYVLFNVALTPLHLPNETWFGPSTPSSIVPSNPILPDPGRESVAISVVYSTQENYTGSMTILQCWFVSGILEYNVVVGNNGTTISLDESQGEWPVVALANNSKPLNFNKTSNSSISIVLEPTADIFNTSYTFSIVGGDTVGKAVYDSSYLNAFALKQINKNKNASILSISNPMPAILSNLNEILFRGGVAAATDGQAAKTLQTIDEGLNLTQTVPGQRTYKASVFFSDFGFWAGASVLQAVAIIFIGTLFWGWWHVGRNVSFSPLEIAKAFDAPLLRDAYSNGAAREVVTGVDNVRLRYGFKAEDPGEDMGSGSREGKPSNTRLVFGKYEEIRPLQGEERFTA